ncbi:hypothetical protein WISP_89037 [Willisornis vidua]|uniref:Vps41 C-terminal RING finger domain-containing protein n=1 Tax=Willisornis vidua TaxID=1566151 RepID=A0ABQ9D365_9PASS|nr:hypothetical protein WISP_89037 [Willisornis vidua]
MSLKAVDMLLDNEDKISIDRVVEELENRPELQHVYLHKLFKRDHHKGQRYHEKQISLYAEYDRPNLLPFLRDSTHCPLEKALEICQQRNFVEETVYLLTFITGLLNNIGTHVDPILLIHRIKEGMEIPNLRDSLVKILQDYNLQKVLMSMHLKKSAAHCIMGFLIPAYVQFCPWMGNSRSALKMIMEELQDVDKAIEFAKEQDDGELWEDLISYSIDKPHDQEKGMDMPSLDHFFGSIAHLELTESLWKALFRGIVVLENKFPNISLGGRSKNSTSLIWILLREGCKKILVADSLSLLKKMHRTQMKGVLVDEENICESCLSPILPSDASKSFNVVVFHCRHMFHKECLPVANTVSTCLGLSDTLAKEQGTHLLWSPVEKGVALSGIT